MATLCDRLKPMMRVCQLFGMGHWDHGRFWTIDWLLIAVNLVHASYIYAGTYVFITSRLPIVYSLSTIMAVVRLHARFLTPIIAIVYLAVNKAAILSHVDAVDRLVPSVRGVSLGPSALRFAGWIAVTVMGETVHIMAFHVRTGFEFFGSALNIAQFAGSNVWIVTPVLQYAFLVSTIGRGARDINEDIATIGAWNAHRPRWNELQRTAVHLTRSVFGGIIIAFVVFTIMDITFLLFAISISWKVDNANETIAYVIMIFVRAGLVVRLFRTCHRCKTEMKRTIIILNKRDKSRFADYKEFRITTLYMMHNDFDFSPCNIFDISYKNLVTITTIIVAYSTFQIQIGH